MDYISGAVGLANTASQIYNDYTKGRELRLGQYKGHENIKKLGHYNNLGKRLAIYHK